MKKNFIMSHRVKKSFKIVLELKQYLVDDQVK